jgi:hypothetical protein
VGASPTSDLERPAAPAAHRNDPGRFMAAVRSGVVIGVVGAPPRDRSRHARALPRDGGRHGGDGLGRVLRNVRRASASEVLTSQTVKDLTAGSGLTFEDRGKHELKGVPDRWHLYRVASKRN